MAGKAAGGAVALIAGLHVVNSISDAFRTGAPAADDYAAALLRVADAADSATATRALDDLFGDVGNWWSGGADDMLGAMDEINRKQHDVIGNMIGINTGYREALDRFAELDNRMSEMDFSQAEKVFGVIKEGADQAGWSAERLVETFPEYAAKLNAAAAAAGLNALTTEEMVAAMAGLESPIDTAAIAAERWSEAVKAYHTEGRGAAETSEAIAERLAAEAEAAKAAEEEWVSYLNALASGSQSFTSLSSAMDVFADDATASLGKYLDALEEQIAAQNNWEANMLELSGRASQGLIDHLAEMGAEGAPLVAALVDATDEELARMERNFRESGSQSSMGWAEGLAEGAPVWAALGQKMGAGAVREAAAEVAAGKATLQGIIDRYDLQATIDANADPAIQAAEAAMSRISRMTATMDVKARIRSYHASGLHAPVGATGGYMADIAEAYSNRLATGGQAVRVRPTGLLNGPGTGTSDDIFARLSTREFITNADATAYYGVPFMYALNQKRIPRDWLTALGFAGGGSPSTAPPVTATSTPVASMVNRTTTNVTHVYQIDRLEFPGVRMAAEVERVMDRLPELAQQRGVRRG